MTVEILHFFCKLWHFLLIMIFWLIMSMFSCKYLHVLHIYNTIWTSLHFTHFTHSHIPHSHTPHSHHSLTLSLTHWTWTYIHTHTTNSPTITAPSLLYFLFPSCFSMLSLSLKKLVTCGVIRSFNVIFLFAVGRSKIRQEFWRFRGFRTK